MEGEPATKILKLEDGTSAAADVTEDVKTVETVDDMEVKVSEQIFTDKDVGIEEYISKLPGFHAIIKQRYSDFLVNEIDENGKVVEMTNLDPPPSEEKKKEQDDVSTSTAEAGNTETVEISEMCLKLISADDIEKLKKLKESEDKREFVFIEAGENKDRRCLIHQAIRKSFPGMESTTTQIDNKSYIKVHKSGGRHAQFKKFKPWSKERGDYCRFILYKENKDTMDALWILAKYLRISRGRFQFSGTKDRRGKTTQEVTGFRVEAEHLLKTSKSLKNIVVASPRYVRAPLRLGKSTGNKFVIVLRNVLAEDSHLDQAMTSLKEKGFINYFGMQRFGTTVIPTYTVGLAVIKGKWQEAVELLLKPRPGEDEKVTKWRTVWWKTRNADVALRTAPSRHELEKSILKTLKKHGDRNFSTAIGKISRNVKLMYLHSYQSYVWNQSVSRRIQQYGLQPVVGDLVLPHENDAQLDVDIVDDVDINEGDGDVKEDDEDKEEKYNRYDKAPEKPLPIVVDESNLSQFTIYDVVVPMPGFEVIYPENQVRDWIDEILTKDGLSIEIIKSKNKGQYKMPGKYRRIVARPRDTTWQTYRYDDVTIPLALSDMDKFKELPEPQSVEGGKMKALKVTMSLPASCYATMAIRELVKTDTSSAHQTTLNPKGDQTENISEK